MRRILAFVLPLALAFPLFVLIGCSSGTSSGSGQTNNAAPAIASISPSSLNAGAPAQNITITGTGFTSGSVVFFSGTPLQTTYTSSTSLQAAVPAALLANGQTASITVANTSSGGGTSSVAGFAVNAPIPQISGITPNNLLQSSSGTLLVTGTGFEANSSVLWNGSARATSFVNTTTLQVYVAAADTLHCGFSTGDREQSWSGG